MSRAMNSKDLLLYAQVPQGAMRNPIPTGRCRHVMRVAGVRWVYRNGQATDEAEIVDCVEVRFYACSNTTTKVRALLHVSGITSGASARALSPEMALAEACHDAGITFLTSGGDSWGIGCTLPAGGNAATPTGATSAEAALLAIAFSAFGCHQAIVAHSWL